MQELVIFNSVADLIRAMNDAVGLPLLTSQ